jgi:hypothetical protein
MSTTRIRDEAFARGSLGAVALAMMTDVFEFERRQFPLLADQSVEDLVHSFYTDKNTGYANAVIAAPNDAAAKRMTRTWATRWMVDETRKHPYGALRNRIEKRLGRSLLFRPSSVAHYWCLADGEDVDTPVSDQHLRQLAAAAHVEVTKTADGDGVRLGKPGELEDLLRRMISSAGRLHIADITRICADRFPSTLQVGDAYVVATSADWEVVEETTAGDDGLAETARKRRAETIAADLLPHLSERDRTAIVFAGAPAGLAAALGVGRSSAYTIAQALRARLVELAGDDAQGREVLAALVRLVLDETPVVPSLDGVKENTRAL